jgi:hypothetical protein
VGTLLGGGGDRRPVGFTPKAQASEQGEKVQVQSSRVCGGAGGGRGKKPPSGLPVPCSPHGSPARLWGPRAASG